LARSLKEVGLLTGELDESIVHEVEQEAREALEFAIASPDPDASELTRDVRRPFKPLGELGRISLTSYGHTAR
jgi:TPP-dependent pyruvate/acetoin dehydrogenase alpha subunit